MTLGSFFSGLLLWLCVAVSCSRDEGGNRPESSPPSEPLRVAVAANFTAPAKRLARLFEERSAASVEISTGSTGTLYAQIENGAPFHVFLSADARRPAELEASGRAVEGSRFRYAVGRLALYGPGLTNVRDGAADLERKRFQHLAIANPDTAPYGSAAAQVLRRLGLWDTLSPRIARGENIAQAYQFVASGAAELGFVALSSVVDDPQHPVWRVPAELHDPIAQEAVLLKRGAGHPHGRAFLHFLRNEEARRIIEAAGYDTKPRPG